MSNVALWSSLICSRWRILYENPANSNFLQGAKKKVILFHDQVTSCASPAVCRETEPMILMECLGIVCFLRMYSVDIIIVSQKPLEAWKYKIKIPITFCRAA